MTRCWMLYFNSPCKWNSATEEGVRHDAYLNRWVVGTFGDDDYRNEGSLDGQCWFDSAHDTLDAAVQRLRELSGEVVPS